MLSNYQSAKSILTVGNTLSNGDLNPSSSRGPAAGGRMKPEIVATGTNVVSTIPDDTYGSNTGTSMASPAVAGGLALLYQRYRQLHGGQNPKNSLMKAILCNTATDLGNPGPDFLYGFGWMNLSRAVQALDGSSYFEDSVKQAANKTHTIRVPEGTAQLKIMLYWQDPPASTLSGRALVNDLDLSVSSPDGNIILPLVLDTTPSRVAKIATRGEDHINNMEQVVIDQPLAGTYTIKVKGTEIPLDPSQEYVITYDIVPAEVRLTYPVGNESLVPGEMVSIQWDSWGESSSTFSLQYSLDKGSSWQEIANTIAATKRQYDWLVPASVTNQAVVRIIRNSDLKTHVSAPFVILGTPNLSLNAVQCPGYISMKWMAVPGATHYEIMKAENGETVRVDTTSNLFYTFKNLSENVTYWVSVRACLNESHGRRSRALSRLPRDGNCTGSISDKDLKMDSILSPLVGREHTSMRLEKKEVIRVRIKNLDDAPVTGFTVSYSVNGGAWVQESTPLRIAALATTVFDFSVPYNFSLSGNYRIAIAVNLPGDTNPGNDTLRYTIRHLANPPVGLSSYVLDDFESTTPSVFTASYMGIEGASRFDVDSRSSKGGVEVVSKGMSDTSGKALRLIRPEMGSNYLVATYNLSLYDTSSQNIGLEFTYSKINSGVLTEDSVWIRGSDTASWIAIMNLDLGVTSSVTNKKTNVIEVGNHLRTAGQNYSSSFQVRWGQQNSYIDYVLDDIRLFDISTDVALLRIDSLPEGAYHLSSATPLRLTIRNYSRLPIAALPLKYRVNGGSVITDTVRNVPANSTVPFTFSRPIDLSELGAHYIETWTDWADDNYSSNNYLTLSLQHQPLVTTYPYLEDFEKSNGWWYAKGANSSWQYGEPRSGKITGAASGTKAWKTNLAGKYNDYELSYLYSPFFDLGALKHPMVSFSLALNTDSCAGFPCDYAALEFSTNGLDWKNVVPFSQAGFNWASRMQSKTYSRWHVATTALPDTVGVVQFRFLFRTDPYVVYEGVGIDDVHIYDSTAAIYDSPESPPAITQNVRGQGWTDFKQNGQLLLSLFPNGQNLGNTTAQAFLQNGPVKNFHGQHYLSRNYVIHPGVSSLNDSIGVRLYFLDKETDALLFTSACPSCPKPAHAYRFGISQYFSPKSGELNGQLLDNIKGVWSYTSFHSVKTVPYQKGYYLEFKLKDFSELWVNSGGYDQNSYLPVRLLDYSVKKSPPQKIMIQWRTASEINMQRFEIEVAKGNKAFEQDAYEKQGEVLSKGANWQPQNYLHELVVQAPKGVYYYRLKMLDEFGNFSYSKALPVILSPEMEWKIAPNVSPGIFNLSYQLSEEQKVTAEIFNAIGSLVKKEQFKGNGFIQKHVFDLNSGSYPNGIYWIRVSGGGGEYLFKVVKQ